MMRFDLIMVPIFQKLGPHGLIETHTEGGNDVLFDCCAYHPWWIRVSISC